MESLFERITLIILFILKLRDIISQNFDIPMPKKLKWIIYNKKTQEPVLCTRAYKRTQLLESDLHIHSIIQKILIMDSKHITHFPSGYFRRSRFSSEMHSEFFINTLEASYVPADLETMTIAIRRLLALSGLDDINFVLFPKSGNQILAQNILGEDDSVVYICKIDKQNSYIPQGNQKSIDSYSIQFENLNSLLELARSMGGDGKLTGVAIDCSISTGSGLKDSINEFNKLLSLEPSLRINKIEHAFILYCHNAFDDTSITYSLHRYFDMDEEIRKMIYDDIKCASNKSIGAKKVYKRLKEKNLIHHDY